MSSKPSQESRVSVDTTRVSTSVSATVDTAYQELSQLSAPEARLYSSRHLGAAMKGVPDYFPIDCRRKVALLQAVNLALLDKPEVNPDFLISPAHSCEYIAQSNFGVIDKGSLTVCVGPCLGLLAFSKSGSRVAALHLEAAGDDYAPTRYSSDAVQGILRLFRYVIGSPVETIVTFSFAKDLLQFHECVEHGISEVFEGVQRFQLEATQIHVDTKTAQFDARWMNLKIPIASSIVQSIWGRR